MKYEQIWNAVDKLAQANNLTPSGLAKKAGLDATTFNKSKRLRPDGNKRWPSLDSLNKITEVCNISFEEFCNLGTGKNSLNSSSIPYCKFSSLNNVAIKNSRIESKDWNRIRFPEKNNNFIAIELDFGDFEPIYKKNSTIIIAQNSEIRKGDRIVVFLDDGRILIQEFIRRTANALEVSDLLNPKFESIIAIPNIKLVNRVVWA